MRKLNWNNIKFVLDKHGHVLLQGFKSLKVIYLIASGKLSLAIGVNMVALSTFYAYVSKLDFVRLQTCPEWGLLV